MSSISKIVVATDFSENSERALEAAIEQAKAAGASLVLCHAFDLPLPAVYAYDVVVPDVLIAESRKSAHDKLEQQKARAEAAGVEVTSQLTEVPASQAIVRVAGEIGADLIVLGTHGHTGLKHVLLGSVAERTVRSAPCSVLVVR